APATTSRPTIATGTGANGFIAHWASHVPISPQRLETAAILRVLGTAGPFGDVGKLPGPQLFNDLLRRPRLRLDGVRARITAQRSVTLTRALVVVQRHGRNRFAIDVLPDVEFGPIQQRVNPNVRAGRKFGLVLIPELGRLIGDIPRTRGIARREVAFLRPAALLVGADSGDDSSKCLGVRVDFIPELLWIEAVARPLARQGPLECFGLEQTATGH